MLSVSFCRIFVDTSFAECDVSMDQKSTFLCTHLDPSHLFTSCLVLVKPNTAKERERGEGTCPLHANHRAHRNNQANFTAGSRGALRSLALASCRGSPSSPQTIFREDHQTVRGHDFPPFWEAAFPSCSGHRCSVLVRASGMRHTIPTWW